MKRHVWVNTKKTKGLDMRGRVEEEEKVKEENIEQVIVQSGPSGTAWKVIALIALLAGAGGIVAAVLLDFSRGRKEETQLVSKEGGALTGSLTTSKTTSFEQNEFVPKNYVDSTITAATSTSLNDYTRTEDLYTKMQADNTFATTASLASYAQTSEVYTKMAADAKFLISSALDPYARTAEVYTKGDADAKFLVSTALDPYARTAEVYTRTDADNIFLKAVDLDPYAKTAEVYTRAEIDEILKTYQKSQYEGWKANNQTPFFVVNDGQPTPTEIRLERVTDLPDMTKKSGSSSFDTKVFHVGRTYYFWSIWTSVQGTPQQFVVSGKVNPDGTIEQIESRTKNSPDATTADDYTFETSTVTNLINIKGDIQLG